MLGNLQKKSIIITVLILFTFFSSATYAEDNINYNNKVFMIIVNRLSLSDIEYMDNLQSIIEDGSIGLMNTRGAVGYKGADSFITISASSKSYSSYETANFFNLDKEVSSIYERRTGKTPEGYSIANTEINKLNNLNNNRTSNSVIGALGDNLHNSGHKTAVFGNSDTADSFIRTSCFIAMDSNGLIDFGNVDNVLMDASDYPFGIKINFNKILYEIQDTKSKASLFVIETGDLDRLNKYSKNLTEEMFFEQRKIILKDIDEFIWNLFTEVIDEKSMLIIASPNSPEDKVDNSKLSPLIVWDGGKTNGILTSGTTRRDGIVSNIDIAPTVTSYLGANNENFIGHVISASRVNGKLDFVKELNARVNTVSSLRAPYLNFYCFLIISIIVLGLFVMFIKRFNFGGKFRAMNSLILLILTLPLVFLLIAYFNLVNSFIFLITSLLMVLVILVIMRFIKNDNRIILLLTITYLSLVIDLVTGGNLLRYSILSYDPIIGARFFGIGNEFAGVILASMAMITALYMEKTRGNKLFLIILPITIVCVSHPNLGVNLGGTISVLFTSIVYLLLIFKVNINLKKTIFIGIIVLSFILLVGIVDIYINTNPSHLGRTLLVIINSGPMYLVNVMLRKVQMNVKLMGSSIWSRVLLVTIFAEISILLRCKKKVVLFIENNRYFSAGIISTLLGSIVGLLVNDSGVLLAAIANTYLVGIMMYCMLDLMSEN